MKKMIFILLLVIPVLAQSYEQKIAPLTEGNGRYLKGVQKYRDYTGQRDQQKKGQSPYAIIVTCADSRVPPEILFDEDLGKLFVVRVAGNIVSPEVLGSIEYAAEHLHVGLLVIMGHSACGAVAATIAGGDNGKNINSLTDKIKPAVAIAQGKTKNKNLLLPLAIEANVELQINNSITGSKIIQELVEEKKFSIVGAVYSIETGEVVFFPVESGFESHGGSKEKQAAPKKKEHSGDSKNEHGYADPNRHSTRASDNRTKEDIGHAGKSGDTEHLGNTTELRKKANVNNTDNLGAGGKTKYQQPREKQVKPNIFSDGELYCIQLSSWKNREKAEKEKDKLVHAKHKAFIAPFTNSAGEQWFRVRIGYFSGLIETQLYVKEQDLTFSGF